MYLSIVCLGQTLGIPQVPRVCLQTPRHECVSQCHQSHERMQQLATMGVRDDGDASANHLIMQTSRHPTIPPSKKTLKRGHGKSPSSMRKSSNVGSSGSYLSTSGFRPDGRLLGCLKHNWRSVNESGNYGGWTWLDSCHHWEHRNLGTQGVLHYLGPKNDFKSSTSVSSDPRSLCFSGLRACSCLVGLNAFPRKVLPLLSSWSNARRKRCLAKRSRKTSHDITLKHEIIVIEVQKKQMLGKKDQTHVDL